MERSKNQDGKKSSKHKIPTIISCEKNTCDILKP